jgi:hypothetical protein
LRGPPAGLSRLRIGGGQLESVKEDLVPLQDLNKDSVIYMVSFASALLRGI